MSYTIRGTIKEISETQEFASGFTKREFVVTEQADKYPQDIKLEVVKERCAELDALAVGQKVEVQFNIRGNEHNGRHFVNLQAWKIEALTMAPEAAQSGAQSGGDVIDEQMPF